MLSGIDMEHVFAFDFFTILDLKDYLCYKMITSQNVSSEEEQVKNFFHFIGKLCSVAKILNFLYF